MATSMVAFVSSIFDKERQLSEVRESLDDQPYLSRDQNDAEGAPTPGCRAGYSSVVALLNTPSAPGY